MGKRTKSRSKNRDPVLVELKNVIDQIGEMCGCSRYIKTKVRQDRIVLRFSLKDVGFETEDVGILFLSYDDSNLTMRFKADEDRYRTGLSIGRKIVMNYLRNNNILQIPIEEVDLLGYFSITSQNSQGVLYDMINLYSTHLMDYYYFNLCINCCNAQVQRTEKSIKNARNTLDLYSGLCRKCRDSTSSRPLTNVVTDAYRKDPNIIKFLIQLSIEALGSKDRFTPFPVIYSEGSTVSTYDGVITAFSDISKDMTYWISKLDSVDTDGELHDSLADREYEFLKFVIESNNTILSYFDYQFGSKDNSAEKHMIETDVWEKSNLIVFAVTHDAELEDRFNKVEKSTYLYHGSPAPNWHSILRNGLKNYSGTSKQSHGAAHGKGVYLAGNSATSMGYSGRGKHEFTVIAIAQVIDASKYTKNNSIYVVPDDSKVLIKYLILNKGGNNQNKKLEQIFKYLTVDLPATLDHNRGCMSSITDRRLRGEYANLQRQLNDIRDEHHMTEISLVEEMHNHDAKTESGDVKNKVIDPDIDDLSLKSRTWIIKFESDQQYEVRVDISYQYPLVPPKITIRKKTEDTESMPLIVKDDDCFRYCEPILNHLSWNPGTKIWSIIAFLVESLIALSIKG
jgi:Poly(ADP-ribose) polymerase catalytic domain